MVVHHDKLKLAHSRKTVDTSWVKRFQSKTPQLVNPDEAVEILEAEQVSSEPEELFSDTPKTVADNHHSPKQQTKFPDWYGQRLSDL